MEHGHNSEQETEEAAASADAQAGNGHKAEAGHGVSDNAAGEEMIPLSDSGEVEALKRELAESRDRYVRLMADFENFKKRALKEQSELLKYQGERIIIDMLEVLDNLELALSHSSAEYQQLKTGLEMIQKMFVERLAKWEVRGEAGVGSQFDPQKHSAISRVPGSDQKPGTIVGELKKAYFYKDKLIRPGEVVVAAESDA